MDENLDTNLFDLAAASEQESSKRSSRPLPTYLIVLAGGIPGDMIRLAPGATRVGRAADNAMRLAEGTVSRHHAVFRTGSDGRVRLSDLASTNGTLINGRRLVNHTPTALHDGDRIQFGKSTVYKFVQPDPYEEEFQREMFERTVRDALTGLFNRSYFLDQADVLAEQSTRKGLGLAILMIDIDRFKAINDTYGHDAGDKVLRETAAVLRQSTRSEDLVARYGGEEFVVALPFASPDQATERAERIRANLAARRVMAGGQPIRVTASIGLTAAQADCPQSIGSLIAAADLGLYEAKRSGRNRVICHAAKAAGSEPPTREDDAESASPPHAEDESAVAGRGLG